MIDFWDGVRGVIHVGGNIGQEVEFYAEKGLPVIWIEPIPQYYEILKANIKKYRNQKAIRELVADKRCLLELNIASNHGASSSIFRFSKHKELWPNIEMVSMVRMAAKPLPDILMKYKVRDVVKYNCLVLDTQGSELLILKGAKSILFNFDWIRLEAADFDAYAGGCKIDELDKFLLESGFEKTCQDRTAGKPDIGNYFEVLYRRKDVE